MDEMMMTDAAATLGHLRQHHVGEPEIAADIGAHDALIDIIGRAGRGTHIGIHRGVADQHIDSAP